MSYPFKNLIFEGGGVKGLAYVGALQEMKERNVLENIVRVGGTSAGAINAVLISAGFDLTETRDILWNLNFKNFMDDSWGLVRDTNRLINEFGWYKGDFFRTWMGKLIMEKTGNEHSTFNDLKNLGLLDLYLVGTNLSTGFAEVFSYEHTPRMRVVDAVRISMSIPLFFASVRGMRGDVYVDGGVLNNYPIKLFDREKYIDKRSIQEHGRRTDYYDDANKTAPRASSNYIYNRETIGFRLDSGREIAVFRDNAEPLRSHIGDFFDYAKSLISTMISAQDNLHLHGDDWSRTVYIDTIGVGTTEFDISDDKKSDLINEGKQGCKKYFDWYDDPQNSPLNRP